MEPWEDDLREGRPDAAWDRFLDRYRRLIFATIRHYADDYDDVMDVFAHVCENLRKGGMARLRARAEEVGPRARFSTWLVAVVRHQTVDWFRHRDGRRRLSAAAESLPPLQRRIFELVFVGQRSHVEAYEVLRTEEQLSLPFAEFLRELTATYHAVASGRRGHMLSELAKLPPPDTGGDPNPTRHLEDAQLRKALEQALQTLEPNERLAIQLYVIEEVPAEQVARVLQLPNAKAVYNRVYRTLATLRERLEAAGIHRGDL
jgi:RNA polymerase sigma factor (sigma-70 family)